MSSNKAKFELMKSWCNRFLDLSILCANLLILLYVFMHCLCLKSQKNILSVLKTLSRVMKLK